MTANIRARAIGYGINSPVSSTELQTIQTQAAQAVNRNSSSSGWRSIPACLGSTFPAGHYSAQMFTTADELNHTHFPVVGLPPGHLLAGVRIKLLIPNASREGNAPEHLPFARLESYRYSTADITDHANTSYTWIDEATYEAATGIVLTLTPPAPITIDPSDYAYSVFVTSEHGINAYTNAILIGIQVNVTLDVAEGGADFRFW